MMDIILYTAEANGSHNYVCKQINNQISILSSITVMRKRLTNRTSGRLAIPQQFSSKATGSLLP